jgi:eukaryotic-like serine/threonine-protein kinase
MRPDEWQQLDKLFHSALEREPAMRAAYLMEACGGDEALRSEVESLLAAHEQADSFIEKPALEVEARSLADEQVDSKDELLVGQIIGHYRIDASLGAGGMGEVYLAEDTRLGRQVALKFLPADFTKDRDRLRRFEQEARAASRLNHPNIITIYEFGQFGERHFIATEYIEGMTLRERLAGRALTLTEALDVIVQVASALETAHAKGIVHRDIKPENIMLRRDRIVKVLDFGLAKLTEGFGSGSDFDSEATTRMELKTASGIVTGTARYMSPEQARGNAVDARTDIWSLGCVLYEMLAGRAPFEGSTLSDVLVSVLEREPPPLARYAVETTAELEWAVKKALRKDRDERYQTIKELLADLKGLKRQLEMEADLERAGTLERRSEASQAESSGDSTAGTLQLAAAQTDNANAIRTTPNAESNTGIVGRRKLTAPLILAALVAATIAAAYFVYSRYFAASGKAGIASIAVLPFTNASNNPDMEYLSDGVSESLINSLSQLPGIKIIARSSSFKYKGKEINPQEVASALGVQAIMTGRIVERGDNLQISVEVVDTRDNTTLWGAQYNRKAADLQAVQEEIARTISEKLRLKLTGAQEQQLTKRATENPEAYQLYLSGEFYIRKTGMENNRKALDYYNQAIALDPNFAEAYAGVAEVYNVLAESGSPDPRGDNAKAKAAAEKALELDTTLARAHVWLGCIKLDEWDWPGAEKEFKRAFELNPNLQGAHALYTFYLTAMGRHTEALAEIKFAEELDPLHVRPKFREAVILYNARRYDEAIKQMHNVLELQPGFSGAHFFIGASYAMKGMYAEAINEYQTENSNEDETASGQSYLGYAYAMSGKRDEAQAILNKLKATKEYVSPAELAILYAGLGDKEGAFQSLERAYAAHDFQLQFLKVEPHYDSLRSDPRFTDLVRRVGLTP